MRRIFPVIMSITSEGIRRVGQDEVAEIADEIVVGRRERPDGPSAPIL
jgi:proteasome beta subunit